MKKYYFGVMGVILSLGMLVGCSEEVTSENTDTASGQEVVETKVPEYEIVEEGDVNVANAIRLEYWVVPADTNISEDEVKVLTTEIVENAKEEQDLNAVVVWVIEEKGQVGTGYTIAKAEYAPEGEWAKAVEIEKGEYETHEYTYDFVKK